MNIFELKVNYKIQLFMYFTNIGTKQFLLRLLFDEKKFEGEYYGY